MTASVIDPIVSPANFSEETGIPVGTLRYWRHAGIGPASFKLGRRIAYRRSELDRWLAEREAETIRGGVA